ncbi:TIGR00296 family protein [Candidatus Woesearchaeota archaeon]|nr:MAG: TIGR00296 family protein [Candidatus Woesearchaeota archaeon]
MKKYSVEEAKELIALARKAIEDFYVDKDTEAEISDEIKEKYKEKRGVFVSIYVDGELQGCIGFAYAVFPLWKAVIKAAVGAAFEDPRFPPLLKENYKKSRIELTILTEPEPIEIEEPEDYLKKIKIGKHGLMVKDAFGSGLLLPQVAVDEGWSVEEFLNYTCMKAGLDADCWRNKRRNVYWFEAQVFSEEDGKVVEKRLEVK